MTPDVRTRIYVATAALFLVLVYLNGWSAWEQLARPLPCER